MLGASMYMADPHALWQRGRNEHLNGLLRQYFPRSRDFSSISPEELQRVGIYSTTGHASACNCLPRSKYSSITNALHFKGESAPANHE